MPKNLELKARIQSLPPVENIAINLPADYKGLIQQRDTYFSVPHGRLKLREIKGAEAELIFYERPEAGMERWSLYKIFPTSDPAGLLSVLEAAFPVHGIVEKERSLYLYKNARIHLDTVKNLGIFLEFEVVVESSEKQAQQLMTELRDLFSISEISILHCSYIDFL